MLEFPSEGAAATLRQLFEGQLTEFGHEPKSIQVIVASTDLKLHLVDDS